MMDLENKHELSLRSELYEKMTTLASSGLGLVAAFAWNDAIQELFRTLFGTASTLVAKFVYALLITTVVVALLVYLSRLAARVKELSEKFTRLKK